MNAYANTVSYSELIADFDRSKASTGSANRRVRSTFDGALSARKASALLRLAIASGVIALFASIVFVFAV